MTDTQIKSPWGLPAETFRLVRLLLEQAEETPEGLRWVFDVSGYGGDIRTEFSPNLADGSAGVVATLLNAYSATRNEECLQAGKKGINYLLHYLRQNDTPYLGLYRGVGGIALLCAHLTRITGEVAQSREVLDLLTPRVDQFLASPYTTHTLLNGRAGALIAFLHLAAATGDPAAWKPVYQIADDMLRKARLGHDGLYWRPYYPEIGPLCGLAEGNSGIAWSFAELTRLTGVEAWSIPAEMALEYEIASLEDDRTPDRRKGIRTAEEHAEHLAQYRAGNKEFFETPSHHSGWGYGDVGTLLAWQRIAKISPTEQYVPAFPEKAHAPSYGRPDLLSEDHSRALAYYRAAVLLDDARPLSHTREFAEQAITKVNTNDFRLLGGFPGILNMLFAGSAPTHIVDYFFPVPIRAHIGNVPPRKKEDVRRELLSHPFRRTMALLDHLRPGLIEKYLAHQPYASAEANFFHEYVENHLRENGDKSLQPLKEIFTLEKEIFDMGYPSESYAYRNIKEIARQEDAEPILNLNNEAFVNVKLILNPEVKILAAQRDWGLRWHPEEQRPIEPVELLQSSPEEAFILIRPNATGTSVLENTLNQLSHFVCMAFATPRTLNEAVSHFKETFEVQNDEQLKQVATMLHEQTREFFNTGILLQHR